MRAPQSIRTRASRRYKFPLTFNRITSKSAELQLRDHVSAIAQEYEETLRHDPTIPNRPFRRAFMPRVRCVGDRIESDGTNPMAHGGARDRVLVRAPP
jgi:hypothetical protein